MLEVHWLRQTICRCVSMAQLVVEELMESSSQVWNSQCLELSSCGLDMTSWRTTKFLGLPILWTKCLLNHPGELNCVDICLISSPRPSGFLHAMIWSGSICRRRPMIWNGSLSLDLICICSGSTSCHLFCLPICRARLRMVFLHPRMMRCLCTKTWLELTTAFESACDENVLDPFVQTNKNHGICHQVG